MKGYLLDTNHVSAYFDGHPGFKDRLEAEPPESLFWISAISPGEIEASYAIAKRDPEVVRGFKRFIRETFLREPSENSFVLPIDETSREYYGEIVNRIWKQHGPRNGRVRTEAHLVSLGVDVNDIWIFATAWKHNLVLLTTDKMDTIRGCVPDHEVKVECWR